MDDRFLNEQKPLRQGFNTGIHGARGLFAMSVFVFHIANSKLPHLPIPFYEWVHETLMSLAFGVELFFIISGIVILGAYRRARSLPAFLWDRATRIFPVLWITVLAMFVLTLLGASMFAEMSPMAMLGTVLGNLLALPPIVRIPLIHPAAWSLSYEFAFYLLFVAFGIAVLAGGRWIATVLVAILAVAVFWHHVRATYFLAGLAIGGGVLDRATLRPLLSFPLLWMLIFLASWQTVAIMVGGNIHAAVYSRMAEEPILLLPGIVALLAATFSMAGIAQGLGLLSRLLQRPMMQWLGTISFSFYLWQTPVLAVIKYGMHFGGIVTASGAWAQPVFFMLALPPTLLVSALSQKYLEVGVTKWLRTHASSRAFRNTSTRVALPAGSAAATADGHEAKAR